MRFQWGKEDPLSEDPYRLFNLEMNNQIVEHFEIKIEVKVSDSKL